MTALPPLDDEAIVFPKKETTASRGTVTVFCGLFGPLCWPDVLTGWPRRKPLAPAEEALGERDAELG